MTTLRTKLFWPLKSLPWTSTGVRYFIENIYDYVRWFEGCQKAPPIPLYENAATMSVSELFDTFSMGFAGPLSRTEIVKQHVLLRVEHLIGSPLAWAVENAIVKKFIKFVEEYMIHFFYPHWPILSDSATSLSARVIKRFISRNRIS